MRKRISHFLVFILFCKTLAAPITGYNIDITLTTTSDWCQVQIISGHQLAVLDYSILQNDSPTASIHMLGINQPGNTQTIQVKYRTFLQDPVDSDLVFECTKGDWGQVRVRIEAYQNKTATTLKEFTHTTVTCDPTNRKTFTVAATGFADLDHIILDKSQENVPGTLFAFYYPWYGTPDGPNGSWFHWEPSNHYASTHEPFLGYYDSGSAAVQQQHLQWAQQAGIDVLICSWWGIGSYEDRRFAELLAQAQYTGYKLSIYFENNGEMEGAAQDKRPEIVEKHLRHVLDTYADRPAFFHYQGRPAIFLYGLPLSRLTYEQWHQVVSELTNQGYQFFISVDSYDLAYIKLFDGFHTYNLFNNISK